MRTTVLTSVKLLVIASIAILGLAYLKSIPFPQPSTPGDPARMPKANIHIVPTYPNVSGAVKYGALSGSPTSTADFVTEDKVDVVLSYYKETLAVKGWEDWGPATPLPNQLTYEWKAYIVDIKALADNTGKTSVSVMLGMMLR